MITFKLLRERKIIQWAVAYVAAAFALLQGIDIVAQQFGWPEGVQRGITLALVLGFFVMLVLAWYHGERGAQKVSGTELLILALLLAIGGGMLWRFAAAPAPGTTGVAANAVVEPPAPAQSIAVLPFENMSGNKDNEYFADGIAEELLNQLAQLPGLQVAGRTSSFAFKGHDEDLREIGQKLGVAYVVEGSVRRSQDRVRITAQLIRTESGFHVWSQTFDRQLTDIFAVQDEISGAITSALKLNLMGKGAGTPTTKVAVSAYDAFLKGQSLLGMRGSDNLKAAREQLQAALKIDPDYAPALVGLAQADVLIPGYGLLSGDYAQSLIDEAEQAIGRALAKEPDNASAHTTLGMIYGSYRWRWQDAEREFATAQKLAPGSAEVANFSGDFYVSLLDPVRAMATEQRAAELDPLAPFNQYDLGWANMSFGNYAKCAEHAEIARKMSPQVFDPYEIMVWCYGQLKKLPEMHRAIAQANVSALHSGSEAQFLLIDTWAAMAEERRDEALRLQAKLEPFAEKGELSSAMVGYNYLLLGESKKARYWLEQAYDHRDSNLVFQEPVQLARIAADPVTRDLLERPGLKELVAIRKRNGMFKEL